MKKLFLFYSLLLASTLLVFTSCNDDEDALTDTRLTYYPQIELEGEDVMVVPLGSAFNDPGCSATLNGEDRSGDVVVSGSVDANEVGFYDIYYSLTNEDGFSASTSRTVIVYDPNISTDISGDYAVQGGSYRYWFSSGAIVNFSGQSISVSPFLPGIFYVSDLIGGYYDQRVGYGPDYAMGGYVSIDSNNNITALSGYVPGWGDSYDKFYNGTYNPETGEITYDIDYAASMQFHIILK